jgi:aspartate kinase
MKVYKFGGASVKDSEGINNLGRIVSLEQEDLVIVVSAFGKTTNSLEKVLRSWIVNDGQTLSLLDEIYNYHTKAVNDLFAADETVSELLRNSFSELKDFLKSSQKTTYDCDYDQIVSYGEIWSTIIVSQFLITIGLPAKWLDIRKLLITDERYRDANINWDESSLRINSAFNFNDNRIYITQGFIGGTKKGKTTTLGREGSDYTAALLANILNARSVTVWKDVPGLLNADPKWLPDARKMDEVSYREAVEMTFSGAKVIHPKTIKPLQNKNIPLYVKSFLEPENDGTIVTSEPQLKNVIPVFIRKEEQILLSLLPRDFSFVMGDNLGVIFHLFMKEGIKVNLVEASAVSIDVCVDDEREKVTKLLKKLKIKYSVLYNENVEMLSVRHYNSEAIKRITEGRKILLEQRTRNSVRFVVKQLSVE